MKQANGVMKLALNYSHMLIKKLMNKMLQQVFVWPNVLDMIDSNTSNQLHNKLVIHPLTS